MNLIDKVKAGYGVLKAGEVVSNPVAWKKGQITSTHLVAVLSSIALLSKAFGYDIPLDETQQAAIATLILWINSLFNQYATVASTDKLGFKVKESVGDTSSRVEGEVSDSSKQYELHLSAEDKEKLQDDIRNTMARDSSLG